MFVLHSLRLCCGNVEVASEAKAAVRLSGIERESIKLIYSEEITFSHLKIFNIIPRTKYLSLLAEFLLLRHC